MTTRKIIFIVAGVVMTLILLIIVFAGGIIGFAFYQIGNSEASLKAKAFLRNSEKLKNEIGDVKDFGRFVTGSIEIHNGNGEATVHLKVIGEQKSVNASVNLVLIHGEDWRVSSASFVNGFGDTINLLDPFDSKSSLPARVLGNNI
jgi:hypothetical protein